MKTSRPFIWAKPTSLYPKDTVFQVGFESENVLEKKILKVDVPFEKGLGQ